MTKDYEMVEQNEKDASGDPEKCSEAGQETIRQRLHRILSTDIAQYAIVALVILDSIIVVLLVLIDLEIITIPEDGPHILNGTLHNNVTTTPGYHDDPHATHWKPEKQYILLNVLTSSHNGTTFNPLNNSHSDSGNQSHHEGHGEEELHHSTKEMVEHGLHFTSLTILSIFMIEICFKLYVERLHLLKHKMEIFDAIVVIVSFSMDVAFSFDTVTSAAARDAAGLMVLLRLWRITRILNGVIMTVKKEAKKKVDEVKSDRRKAEAQVEKLQEEVEHLCEEISELKKKLAKYESSDKPTKPSFETNGRPMTSDKYDGQFHT